MYFSACTAERFFRIDRAQEHLHYVTDIANDIIFILDQECPTLPQTPEDDTGMSSLCPMQKNYSSESSDNLEKESPFSSSKKFFNRSLSGPGSGGTSDSLSPGAEIPSRKCIYFFLIQNI